MGFYIAFDKTKNLEFLLYKEIIKIKNICFLDPLFRCHRKPIGSFLLLFLNTNFEDLEELSKFIQNYSFENLFYKHNPKFEIPTKFIYLSLKADGFEEILKEIFIKEQFEFLYAKNLILKLLNLPHDSKILKQADDKLENDGELTDEQIQIADDFDRYLEIKEIFSNYTKEKYKDEYEKIEKKFNEDMKPLDDRNLVEDSYLEINNLIQEISLDFSFGAYLISGIPITNCNVPYSFYSKDVLSIVAIEFKEFVSNERNRIRQCQNCGKYFIPKNLKETKYCNNIFKNNKTCKQIGKDITYKKTIKNNQLLDMYRKRYMSLASSVSHYGTPKAIQKFEKYKEEGAIMKNKYLNKEISKKEFKKWIEESKKEL